jgi:hypothetical protein
MTHLSNWKTRVSSQQMQWTQEGQGIGLLLGGLHGLGFSTEDTLTFELSSPEIIFELRVMLSCIDA